MVTNGNKFQKITNNCKISEITKYGEKITQIDKNWQKCQKQPTNGQISKKQISSFTGSKLPHKNWYSGLKQLKMDLNALKYIFPKKGEQMPKNGNKCQEMSENDK